MKNGLSYHYHAMQQYDNVNKLAGIRYYGMYIFRRIQWKHTVTKLEYANAVSASRITFH